MLSVISVLVFLFWQSLSVGRCVRAVAQGQCRQHREAVCDRESRAVGPCHSGWTGVCLVTATPAESLSQTQLTNSQYTASVSAVQRTWSILTWRLLAYCREGQWQQHDQLSCTGIVAHNCPERVSVLHPGHSNLQTTLCDTVDRFWSW